MNRALGFVSGLAGRRGRGLGRVARLGALACLVAPSPSLARPPRAAAFVPTVRFVSGVGAAVQQILDERAARGEKDAAVFAFGELHELEGGPAVHPSLWHFTEEVLPVLSPLASDLVLETWITRGDCGKTEKQVVAQVEETTQRPATVETDLVRLVKRARALGLGARILELDCGEYARIMSRDPHGGGDIDYVALLDTITRKLEETIDAARRAQADRARTDGKPPRAVLAYGGAVHTELSPRRELSRFTYAPSEQKKTGGRLVAIDLFVPEILDRNAEMRAQPWVALLSATPAGQAALVRRGPSSYVIVAPRTPAPAASAAAPLPDGGTAADGGAR